jgi:inner membrane protease subunit 2
MLNTLKQTMNSLLLVVPATIMFNDEIASVAFVQGISMRPALNPKVDSNISDERGNNKIQDIVLMDCISANQNFLERGDVIVLDNPHQRKKKIVKRLVALPGDWVKTRKGDLKHVPKGKVWVEGDNFKYSTDSEKYGPIPISMVKAKVSWIIWPPSRWGKVTDARKDKDSRIFIANENDFPRRRSRNDFW